MLIYVLGSMLSIIFEAHRHRKILRDILICRNCRKNCRWPPFQNDDHRSIKIVKPSHFQTCIFTEVEKCADTYTAIGAKKIVELAVALSGIVFVVLCAAQMKPLPTAFSK